MGHCVGGYCDTVASGNSTIFSLRDPKGMPHVTLEVQGDFDGTSAAPSKTVDHGNGEQSQIQEYPKLRVIQVQGKSDTEPIPEYRWYIDDWFQTLRMKHWDVVEDDPDREPDYDYHEHNEGPFYLDNPENYLDYHKIMTNPYDRQYHFDESEEPEYDAPTNTLNYEMPRILVFNGTGEEHFADQALDFIKRWEAGQYTNDDAVKYVQAMWMALHHSAGNGQNQNGMWPRQDADGLYLHSEGLHKVVQKFWQDVEEILYWKAEASSEKGTQNTLFDPTEYNGEVHSTQAKMFLDLMAKFDSAPYDFQEPVMMQKQVEAPSNEENGYAYPKYLYRDRNTGEETTVGFENGVSNNAVMVPRLDEQGRPQMVNRWLQWPGENAYPGTDYERYFQQHGMDRFPTPVMGSWMPLEAHHSAPNGTRVQAWSLTAWKRIEPSEELRNIAHGYMANQGWGDYDPPQNYPDVDPARAARIAQEYEKMEHNPHDPQVRAAYDALMQETAKQYEYLLKHGYQMEFEPEGGAYASPWDAISDVRDNKHLYVYPTSAGFGTTDSPDHPLLENTPYEWNGQPVTYNDLFRGVHDVFGHAKEGVGFRQDGEENAWRQHAAMYSDLARHALTSETRGQNSWVNYGPYGEHNQTADQENTVYAPQKAGLMPDWTAYEGAHDE
jgi:hypothetical protein